MSTQGPADKAADLLIHYFAMTGRRAGIEWDSDNDTEIRIAVDRLMDAARDIAREEARAVQKATEEKVDSEMRKLWDHISNMPGGV